MISVTLSYRRDIREPLVSMTLTATPQINNVSVLHVRHALWNIPVLSSTKQKREVPTFANSKSSSICISFNRALYSPFAAYFTNILLFEEGGIIVKKSQLGKCSFSSDVFLDFAVVVARAY